MKILVFPRDPNPYQELLYAEVAALDVEVTYLGRITPLGSLNLLLLPVELAVRRMRGARIVHLHWVWAFLLPGASRFPIMRRASLAWFRLFLRCARLLGLRLAWTAHNVLPHSPVFPDDIAARRLLVSQCDVVFGHSAWTLTGLTEIGVVPRHWATIRHAPFQRATPANPAPRPSRANGTRELLFFGNVFEYKGVEELLQALSRLPESHRVHLTVAGQCGDAGLRSRIEAIAEEAGERVSLRLQHIPDSDIGQLMREADVAILPFRRITTSGSALLALSHGKPLVIPALPALADLPDGAVFRYDGSVDGLAAALRSVIGTEDSVLARMSEAALAYSSEATWSQVASTTVAEFRKVLGGDVACRHEAEAHEAQTSAS
jgi:glycosyltransferase involved in cell wall biosynthesis